MRTRVNIKRIQIQPGDRYGQLTVIHEASPRCGANGYDLRTTVCVCDCGAIVNRTLNALRSGSTTSCGCVQRYKASGILRDAMTTHGQWGSPTYRTWRSMRQRCGNVNNKQYGGRGVKVCPEWEESFEAFLAHVGERPTGASLDRIDGNKGYEPGNVRWASPKQQARNRRDNLWVEVDGKTFPLPEAAERYGFDAQKARESKRRKNSYCDRVGIRFVPNPAQEGNT